MENKQILGLIGSILIFVGTILPSISLRGETQIFLGLIGQPTTLLSANSPAAIIYIIIAVFALILALFKRYTLLWISGVVCFLYFSLLIIAAARGLIDVIWGSGALIIGAVLLVVTAFIKTEPKKGP